MKELNAVIESRIDLTKYLAIFTIKPIDWTLPVFSPGQFANLGLPGDYPRLTDLEDEKKPPKDFSKLIRRSYSIVSSPDDLTRLEFLITLVNEGSLTPRIWPLKTGDLIYLGEKIVGHFTIDPIPEDKNIILVATGTGIAPYISMLRTYLPQLKNRKISLLHGVRISPDLAYQEELINYSNQYSDFSYFPIISRPNLDPNQWIGEVGHVQKIWESKIIHKTWEMDITPDNTHFMLCGSPLMIEGMTQTLNNDGFIENTRDEPGQIHVEKYW
jgi:ferredoxin--NADP+ reductase